jgi:hypothetical protein
VRESLRLYPPATLTGRLIADKPYALTPEVTLQPGTPALALLYGYQRSPEYWPEVGGCLGGCAWVSRSARVSRGLHDGVWLAHAACRSGTPLALCVRPCRRRRSSQSAGCRRAHTWRPPPPTPGRRLAGACGRAAAPAALHHGRARVLLRNGTHVSLTCALLDCCVCVAVVQGCASAGGLRCRCVPLCFTAAALRVRAAVQHTGLCPRTLHTGLHPTR